MTIQTSKFGREGEKAAEKFLKKKGYRILERNFRTPRGEIDLIAEQDGVLVFIEVKARSGKEFGDPLEALTPAKCRQLGQMAQRFLAQKQAVDRDCRFDVVSLTGNPEKPDSWELGLLVDAFRP